MSDNSLPRRRLVRAVSGATAATALSYSRILGANEREQIMPA